MDTVILAMIYKHDQSAKILGDWFDTLNDESLSKGQYLSVSYIYPTSLWSLVTPLQQISDWLYSMTDLRNRFNFLFYSKLIH